MSCPKCARELDSYSKGEGGWCKKCREWFPPDVIEDFMEENCGES